MHERHMDTAEDRQRWLSLLNRATREQLDAAWDALPSPHPDYILLKRPETGLVMAQGRAGGDGQRFNLGEISVTRAVAGLGEFIGQGYVLGRDHRRAELVAVFDALLQAGRRRDHIVTQLLEPVLESLHLRAEEDRRKADATRVEFFTLARESQ
jgi:alpha-D-ribose 1-methylphosphonate 5-triphosphate synthase subunit PhnG